MKKIKQMLTNKHLSIIIVLLVFSMLSLLPLPWNAPIAELLIDLQFKIRGNRLLDEAILLIYIGTDDIQDLGGSVGRRGRRLYETRCQ